MQLGGWVSGRTANFHWSVTAELDYGIGIVGKCLGPTTSKGPTKDGSWLQNILNIRVR